MPKMMMAGLAMVVIFLALILCRPLPKVEVPVEEIQAQINSVLPYQGKVGTIFTANFWWAHVNHDSINNRVIVTVAGDAEFVYQNIKKNFNWMIGYSADLNYDATSENFFLTNVELFDYDVEVEPWMLAPVAENLFKMFDDLIVGLPVYRVNKEKLAYELN